MPQENEVKIAAPDPGAARALLKGRGFRVLHARVFEQNVVLDDSQRSMRARNLLLRVRAAGPKVTCTFKGKEIPGIHKRREEREFLADNLEKCLAVFDGLGFTPVFRYEKYRTEFQRSGEEGLVTLDETPIGNFLELEGAARWLNRTAKDLGYSRRDYIASSYSALYAQWCAEYGTDPAAMKF